MSKMNLGYYAATLMIAGGLVGFTAVNANAANDSAGANQSAGQQTPQISKDYAKTQIIVAGYTKPSDLQKTNDGWTAKADESGHPVSLMVNDFGSVYKTNS